ncbi:MAG: FMN-binding protein [Ignavibacteria bacterium]|nr:FMN-binding protein [Ignavibacteria bacterium]
MDRAHEALRRIFPGSTGDSIVTVLLTRDEVETLRSGKHQQWDADSLVVLYPIPRNDTGLAVIDNVRGKDQMITYLVAITPDLVVKDLEIIAYREPYGGEVRNKSWQAQFSGKTVSDPLRPGRDIMNITGATISVRAVTFGVRKILATLTLLRQRLSQEVAR